MPPYRHCGLKKKKKKQRQCSQLTSVEAEERGSKIPAGIESVTPDTEYGGKFFKKRTYKLNACGNKNKPTCFVPQ